MEPKTIFCNEEGARFPVTEFRRKQNGTLIVPYIHDTDSPHYSTTGEPVRDSTTGEPVRGGVGPIYDKDDMRLMRIPGPVPKNKMI
jgi:hypothetical protein